MRVSIIFLQAVFIVGIMVSAGIVLAEDDVALNRFDFQVRESMDVENDRMRVVLRVEAENKDASHLADIVNQTMAWALTEADQFPEVNVATGNYQIRAITKDSLIIKWRGFQLLILNSAHSSVLSRLIGRLQTKLLVNTITFELSPEQRKITEDSLIGKALDAFKARAELITDNFNARNYRIVKASVNTSRNDVRPVAMLQTRVAGSRESIPAVREGTSKVEVRVTGTIELK